MTLLLPLWIALGTAEAACGVDADPVCQACIKKMEARNDKLREEWEKRTAEAKAENERRRAEGKTVGAIPPVPAYVRPKKQCCKEEQVCCDSMSASEVGKWAEDQVKDWTKDKTNPTKQDPTAVLLRIFGMGNLSSLCSSLAGAMDIADLVKLLLEGVFGAVSNEMGRINSQFPATTHGSGTTYGGSGTKVPTGVGMEIVELHNLLFELEDALWEGDSRTMPALVHLSREEQVELATDAYQARAGIFSDYTYEWGGTTYAAEGPASPIGEARLGAATTTGSTTASAGRGSRWPAGGRVVRGAEVRTMTGKGPAEASDAVGGLDPSGDVANGNEVGPQQRQSSGSSSSKESRPSPPPAPQGSPGTDYDALAEASADLAIAFVGLGDAMRGARIQNARFGPGYGAPGGFGQRVFSCDQNSTRPAVLGWCHQGTFTGLIYTGPMAVYAQADKDIRSIFVASFTGTVAGGNAVTLLQVSPFANIVRDDFTGLAQVGAFNRVDNDFRGVGQLGLVNMAGTHNGLAQVGLINTTGRATVLQLGLYSDADRMYGLQVGGLVARGGVVGGVAFSPLVNGHARTYGIEAALVNISGDINGIAFAPIGNAHQDVRGLQVGFLNMGGHVQGVQLGVFNSATILSGVQIGGFNFSRMGGLPFMLGLNVGFGG